MCFLNAVFQAETCCPQQEMPQRALPVLISAGRNRPIISSDSAVKHCSLLKYSLLLFTPLLCHWHVQQHNGSLRASAEFTACLPLPCHWWTPRVCAAGCSYCLGQRQWSTTEGQITEEQFDAVEGNNREAAGVETMRHGCSTGAVGGSLTTTWPANGREGRLRLFHSSQSR